LWLDPKPPTDILCNAQHSTLGHGRSGFLFQEYDLVKNGTPITDHEGNPRLNPDMEAYENPLGSNVYRPILLK
jgi:hypothetical protein